MRQLIVGAICLCVLGSPDSAAVSPHESHADAGGSEEPENFVGWVQSGDATYAVAWHHGGHLVTAPADSGPEFDWRPAGIRQDEVAGAVHVAGRATASRTWIWEDAITGQVMMGLIGCECLPQEVAPGPLVAVLDTADGPWIATLHPTGELRWTEVRIADAAVTTEVIVGPWGTQLVVDSAPLPKPVPICAALDTHSILSLRTPRGDASDGQAPWIRPASQLTAVELPEGVGAPASALTMAVQCRTPSVDSSAELSRAEVPFVLLDVVRCEGGVRSARTEAGAHRKRDAVSSDGQFVILVVDAARGETTVRLVPIRPEPVPTQAEVVRFGMSNSDAHRATTSSSVMRCEGGPDGEERTVTSLLVLNPMAAPVHQTSVEPSCEVADGLRVTSAGAVPGEVFIGGVNRTFPQPIPMPGTSAIGR